MTGDTKAGKLPSRMVGPENRKPRGSGHERPDEILAAARELFLERGVESVTTRQIAKRLGISHAALYVYFKSKEEMLDRLVEAAFRKLGATVDHVSTACPDPVDFLRSIVPAYIGFGLQNPDEYRLAFLLRDGRRRPAKTREEREADVGLAVFEVLADRMAEGVASGQLAVADNSAMEAAQALWASIHGLVALLIAYPDFGWSSVEKLVVAHTEMLLTGLLANGGPD